MRETLAAARRRGGRQPARPRPRFLLPPPRRRRYPAGLDSHDFQGLFGYKVFLVIAILMGEGLYMVLKVLVSSEPPPPPGGGALTRGVDVL